MKARHALAGVLALGLCGCMSGSEPGADRPERAAPDEPERSDVILDAAWSPDGSRLVVTWDRGAGARLIGLLAGTADSPPQPASGLPVSDGRGAWASWSPDGLWVAYEAGGDIVRGRPDGTGQESLTDDPAFDGQPAYSPDGSSILFVSERGGTRGLWVMAADGSDVRPVPLGVEGEVSAPAWDPAGGRFAFQVDAGGASTVYLGRLDGGVGRVADAESPAWSPDGSRLWVVRSDSIFSLPAQGGTFRLEVPDARAPAVSPDGTRLAFVRGDDSVTALYLKSLDDGTEVKITP